MMVSKALIRRFYSPEVGWVDGTTRFSGMIRKHIQAGSVIVDLGCGRGKPGPVNFKGEVSEVIGVEPVKSELDLNSGIDRGLIGTAEAIALEDESVDVVYADWVVEHIVDPRQMALEVMRILKPGGYYLFRTGNRWHYVSAIASLTPQWFHRLVANRVRGLPREAPDPFPTRYRMNTRAKVRKVMKQAGIIEEEFAMVEAEPSYLVFSRIAFLLGVAYERIVNSTERLSLFRACIMGCYRKP